MGASPTATATATPVAGTAAASMNSTLLHDLSALIGILLGVGLVAIAARGVTRSKGKEIKNHIIYAAAPVVLLLFLPLTAKDILFTPLSVVVVGTVFPIYESVRAAVTVETDDDTGMYVCGLSFALRCFSVHLISLSVIMYQQFGSLTGLHRASYHFQLSGSITYIPKFRFIGTCSNFSSTCGSVYLGLMVPL